MGLTSITALSVLCQIAAVIMALRLIRISRARTAWILISLAIIGMGVRRSITLVRLLSGEIPHSLDMPYEIVGFFTSLFMLLGILFIAPIFESTRERETALQRNEARYRNLVDTAQEGIWSMDKEGKTTFANRRMAEMLGYTPEEMLGRPVADFVHGDGSSVVSGILERRSRGVREQYDHRLFRKDGSEIWGLISAAPIQDEKGKFVGAFSMITDITQRKKMEAEREVMVESLKEALANVKTLRGLLPICASCKKIRDDKGYWNQIEGYISVRTNAEFSHSICPECRDKYYPGFRP
jgi:PAS domain S-box-containing protein